MRTILLSLALAATAAPALAQTPDLDAMRFQQEAAARRAVAQANELTVLESRLRTEQALSDLQMAQRFPPRAPELRYAPDPTTAAPAAGAAPKYPSIPDAALAESNRRVRDASQPRR